MYSNLVHTCVDGVGAAFMSDEGTGSFISFSSTNWRRVDAGSSVDERNTGRLFPAVGCQMGSV